MGNDDVLATARVLDLLRGGTWGVAEDREAARRIDEAWPQARRTLAFHDRFRSSAAARAVENGAVAVMFGAAGFPCGEQPHAAAARARPSARFFYVDCDATTCGQRRQSLNRDRQARAFIGGWRDPYGTIAVMRAQGAGNGPWQVHWALGAGVADDGEGTRLAASYARLLAPGSELVIAAPDGAQGRRLAALAGFRSWPAADVRRWCSEAGLEVTVADVRAWGREELGGKLRSDCGRIMGVVARKP